MLCGGVVLPGGARNMNLGHCKFSHDLEGPFGHMSVLHIKPRHAEVVESRAHGFLCMTCHRSFRPAFRRRGLGRMTDSVGGSSLLLWVCLFI